MNYQTATSLPCFEFTLGTVFARTQEEAHRIATEHVLWDRRSDGTWGGDATEAHASLCEDQQAAYRSRAAR